MKTQLIQAKGKVVATVQGLSSDVEYLCSLINTNQHCYVECFYNFGTNDFDIKTLGDVYLCRSVLKSFEGTSIMDGINIQ